MACIVSSMVKSSAWVSQVVWDPFKHDLKKSKSRNSVEMA
jgi:hypothetical protein